MPPAAYSLNGYINAVMQRSSSTLLVEGRSDRKALYRLACETGKRDTISIDEASLIKDGSLSGFGEKQKVEKITRSIRALASRQPGLQKKFASLVDREWDGLNLVFSNSQCSWFPPSQSSGDFVTMGHSIENYIFDIEYLAEYLKYSAPEAFTISLEGEIRKYFNLSLALAGSISFKAKEKAIITRFTDFFRVDHFNSTEYGFDLTDNFLTDAAARGIHNVSQLRQEIQDLAASDWNSFSALQCSKWFLHGHIGFDVLWSCFASVALRLGISKAQCERIANGDKQERLRHWCDWISRQYVDGKSFVPLPDVINWLV